MISKVKECRSCGQGFDEDNNMIGNSVPTILCQGGLHNGPIDRIEISKPGPIPPIMQGSKNMHDKSRQRMIMWYSSNIF